MSTVEQVLFGLPMLLFSLEASASDWKTRKVPNALVKRMLWASLLLNAVYFYSDPSGVVYYAAYAALSLAASVVLWLVGFWEPGDVKFYFALSTLGHPSSYNDFLSPLLLFLVLSVAATIVEGIAKRNVGFRPRFSFSMLLPVALSPVLSLMGASSIAMVFILMFVGQVMNRFGGLIAVFSLISLAAFPEKALRAFLFTLAFSLLSSFKFKGHLPSTPFISASFIYLLASGKL